MYTNYSIEVKTGDITYAGTDANVYIILHGEHGDTEKKVLSNGQVFERGDIDRFKVSLKDVGTIKEITIGHDNKGLGADWYVEYVKVTNENGEIWEFPCHQWLASSGNIEITLSPYAYRASNKKGYLLTIKTGDVEKAGTDANVYVILHGDEGNSEKIILNPLTQGDAFERGDTNQFLLDQVPDIGFIHSVTIGHDDKWTGSGWFLDFIKVQNIKTKQTWDFPCFMWLASDEEDRKIERTLYHQKMEPDTFLPRPIYVIAHMCNSIDRVKQAFREGANAIECDIHVENPEAKPTQALKFKVHHGDYFPIPEYGEINTPLEEYLKGLKSLMPWLSLVIFDCKEIEGLDNRRYGKELCEHIKKHIEPQYCVMSIPYLEMAEFFSGMEEAGFSAAKDISMINENPVGEPVDQWLKGAEEYKCNWLGVGIDAFVPLPLRNWLSPLRYTSYKKHEKTIVKKVYYWTLNNIENMRSVLDAGVDGIICNIRNSNETLWEGLKGLIQILKEPKYSVTHRLADKNDSIDKIHGSFEYKMVFSVSDSAKKFLIRKGVRHLIPDANTFNSLKFKQEQIRGFTDQEIRMIPIGEPLEHLASPVIRNNSSGKIYLMDSGLRRFVPNGDMLKKLGYTLRDAVDVPQDQINKIWLDRAYTEQDISNVIFL